MRRDGGGNRKIKNEAVPRGNNVDELSTDRHRQLEEEELLNKVRGNKAKWDKNEAGMRYKNECPN